MSGYMKFLNPTIFSATELDPLFGAWLATPKNDIQFDTTPIVPGHIEGRLFYDSIWKTFSADIDTDVTLQIGQEELRYVYNATGSTILNGEAVYTNGIYNAGTNDVATVALAKADNATTAVLLGCATQDILNGSYGFVTVRGHINGLDTNEIGRSFLTTQGLFFSARVGGAAGNSYSVQFINTMSGGLTYTDALGVIVIDLGGTVPATTNIVTLIMTTSPSAFVKVKANAVNPVVVAGALPLANGVATVAGDNLYLSAVDAGFLTTVPPSAPNLRVRVGRLITKSSTAGRINIRIITTGRMEDLSDTSVVAPMDGDILIYEVSTDSWKNSANILPTYDTVAALKVALGSQDAQAICIANSTLYRYESAGVSYVPDDKYVTITGNGGVTRWIGISGLYCYDQKSNKFIANKLVVGKQSAVTIINAPTVFDSTIGSFLLLDIQGSNQNITLPTSINSEQGQFLSILVIGTSAFGADLQPTNTNLNTNYFLTPGTWASFEFGQNLWHLAGGKNAITQLDQIGTPTYKTTQDWNNVTQSAGVISGGIATDDGIGGINISSLRAISKVSASDTGGNQFVDVAGVNIPAAALPNGLIDGTNFIYLDCSGVTPIYQVTNDKSTLNRTTQFTVCQVFKSGLDLEIINLESTISNFSRKVVNRLIEVNGINRVSGALVSESGTRNVFTSLGVMYYGLERIVTPSKDTSVSDSFDLYWRNGTGGWHTIYGETQVDRLRFDNNSIPVLVGNVENCTNSGGLIKVQKTGHGLVTNDCVTISGVTGTVAANGTWKIVRIDNDNFTLNNSVFVNAWISGGVVNSLPFGVITSDGAHYGIYWVFICTQGDIYILYGQNEYSLTNAQNATVPATLPPYMSFNCVLAAKIILEPATAAFKEVQSTYTIALATTTPALHNDLGGLNAGDYKHLTAAEYALIAGAGAITTGAVNKIALYSASPTGKTISDNILDNDASNNVSLIVASHALAVNRLYTIPDAGTNASFLMSELAQTINAVKHFTAGVKVPFVFPNADSTTAVQVRKANGSTVSVNIDTTNNVLSLQGTGASTVSTNLKLNSYDTVNDYIQNNIQNLSNGTSATTDWIATADNGNDTSNYIDMGINGSGFTGGTFFPGGWTINGVDSGYLFVSDGELAIGTTNNSSLKSIRFFTGNPLIANQKGMISGTGYWSNGPHTPTSWMHLRAGSATAGTSPLKFTSGVALSAVEDGAMEYDGTHLYFSIGAARQQLDGKQASSTNLTSLAGLTYAATAFVKMTGANTFTLDTNVYLTSLTGAVLTDQTVSQTIGATGARLTKLWATDITCTNTINGTITGLSITSGKSLTVSNILTLSGTDGSSLAIGTGGTLGTAAYTASTAYQASNTNLTSLAGLTYISASFVKMTAAGTFALDTNTYLTSSTGLLATGATTGATAQAQAFTTGVKTSNIFPASDSTTAFQIRKTDGATSVLNVDTTNSRVFISGNTAPTALLHLAAGSIVASTAPLKFTSGPLNTTAEAGTIEYNGDFYSTVSNGGRKSLDGVIYSDVADHTGTGTGETTLGTYTMPANTLDANNEYVEVGATISITGAGNSTVRLYFGSTVIYTTGTANYSGQSIQFRAKIFRTGAATQRSTVTAVSSGNAITVNNTYTTPAETLSGSVVIRVTGQNATDGTRVVERTFDIRHYGASA